MIEVEFVDELPPIRRLSTRQQVLVEFAEALRADPERRWAKWPTAVKDSTAQRIPTHISHGTYAALPPTEFEGAWREDTLYVRFIGEGPQ